jgi:hypothetical protein
MFDVVGIDLVVPGGGAAIFVSSLALAPGVVSSSKMLLK